MTLYYLSKERVLDDHERFAKDIREKYNVTSCTVLEKRQEEQIILGFVIEKDSVLYEVQKQFAENEVGDVAIVNNSFEIIANDVVTHENLYSLQNVFDALGIKKNI